MSEENIQKLAEEMIRLIQAGGPIPLNKPLKFPNKTNGPIITIYNDRPPDDKGAEP